MRMLFMPSVVFRRISFLLAVSLAGCVTQRQ